MGRVGVGKGCRSAEAAGSTEVAPGRGDEPAERTRRRGGVRRGGGAGPRREGLQARREVSSRGPRTAEVVHSRCRERSGRWEVGMVGWRLGRSVRKAPQVTAHSGALPAGEGFAGSGHSQARVASRTCWKAAGTVPPRHAPCDGRSAGLGAACVCQALLTASAGYFKF